MDVVVHRIRLHESTDPARFEQWVRDVDYATCPDIPSIRAFGVHRVSTEAAAPFHYFEVISLTSADEFARDMKTEAFRGLEAEFDSMASVIDEVAGTRVEPGYSAI
ncbi:RedY protein [Streptomyces oceani]|uniref:RedY protein n=1 Tax=Streptomyces oceani TaxID=1075402 RepID=A0A1E7KEU3_9ACTN|nr:RedY protein [Streptomyces oceani]OEV02433.1 RedY protein [Streptomyces oceani]